MSGTRLKSVVWNDLVADKTSSLLLKSGSYKFNFETNKENWYRWKSGIRAPTYCDCRNLVGDFETYNRIATYLSTLIEKEFPDVELVTGIASSGIIWASLVGNILKLPFCFAREKLKSYGIGEHVYCSPKEKSRSVIIDDLCASGGSLRNTVKYLSDEYSIDTLGCVSIVNWGLKEMWNNATSVNVQKVYALTSYDSLISMAHRNNLISEEQRNQLQEFYLSPLNFKWE